jgi:hypothetical protein
VNIDRKAAEEAKEPLPLEPQTAPRPGLADTVQACGVIYGPSAVLDLLALASIGTVIGTGIGRLRGNARSCPGARLVEPLAGLGVALTAGYLLVGRPWLRRWGSTDDERTRALPGDDLVPDPAINSTWSVTINAPVAAVWPWLAQLGQDRGGFYSYEWLENLAGCQMRNADRIHPEWQQRQAGQNVPLHPAAGLPLAVFEPGRAYVLEGWGAFVLESVDQQTTRLISRSRVKRGLQAWIYALLTEIPHFIMQRKMLLGIKERAEQAAVV